MIIAPVSKMLKIIMVVSALIIGSISFGAAYADVRTKAIVTVYSDGKVMKVYEAIDEGRMEKSCYVFHVRRGVRDVEVRACGTFTVEQVR